MIANTDFIDQVMKEHGTRGLSISALSGQGGEDRETLATELCFGHATEGSPMMPDTWLEVASLSKTIAAAFMLEYFAARGTSLDTPVNEVLAEAGSSYRLQSAPGCPEDWAERVLLKQLVDHTGLGMHYVKGVPRTSPLPPVLDLLQGHHSDDFGYQRLLVDKEPGMRFGYSGGGFLVLQHLLESLENRPIADITREFFDACGMRDFSFCQEDISGTTYADGYMDDGNMVPGGRYQFPPLAAGGLGTTKALANFFCHVVRAYNDASVTGPISHETARSMLDSACDKGSMAFMSALMGMGVFVVQAGPNRVAVHQAANEGFRGIYLVVTDGPDRGRGFVVIANGDNQSAVGIAKVVQHLLIQSEWRGVDTDMLKSRANFDFTGIRQEEIVNFAYKSLVFDAFLAAPAPASKL